MRIASAICNVQQCTEAAKGSDNVMIYFIVFVIILNYQNLHLNFYKINRIKVHPRQENSISTQCFFDRSFL